MAEDDRYLHLIPAEVWSCQEHGSLYFPDAYDQDGFIHLTIGSTNLMEVANLFYAQDDRDYLVLTLDKTKITSPVRFDDESGRYPHIYGPLNVDAVIAVDPVRRDAGGAFLKFGAA